MKAANRMKKSKKNRWCGKDFLNGLSRDNQCHLQLKVRLIMQLDFADKKLKKNYNLKGIDERVEGAAMIGIGTT